MREEASPKQWEKLYEVTCNLKALEPWKYFWDTQLVAIFLKDSEEPVFASIMGCLLTMQCWNSVRLPVISETGKRFPRTRKR